ncbi:OTU-like cysteine protease [Colletotrichum scovillei]|uniref:OTU-like cysteine protease n=1 Tax=Colletotrichum scovillei TaxID=1209932 RepID=A0A9P7RFC0_9PEZI|nr:OTU-like cysteine protease [Colletotrichum scovillei]KAF4785768.1 OTU-like cysteine protease [Colletotrichum scovillei]KAG7055392.1 OTU-like cysteine protease [Colletotrichum scovillei]KAG7074862.1 OTU-like cysteine protease [Colletotrichum scovillei]KAG7081776.1 OTU-like cysteine protease [Colletotrichum scovillei]
MESETLEQMQTRHRKEQRDLVGRITSKKKNATKKTRKGVNDECAELERQLKAKHEEEVAELSGGGAEEVQDDDDDETAEVAEKLKDTTISESETPIGEEKERTQIQGQGQGKKRNRQKERLARRAAEVEAAAEKAQEEASGMTDHRGIEKTYMLKEFKANGLEEKEIAPDGHCLFSAVADQLRQQGIPLASAEEASSGGDPTQKLPYKVVRRAAAEYMTANPDDFAPFLEEGLEGYVRRIRDTAEWGGQLELAALASVYGVEIRVVQDGRTERIGPAAGGGESEEKKEIWLAYYRHGYGLGEHYNSLRKTTA